MLADVRIPHNVMRVSDPAMLAGLEHLRFLRTLFCYFADGYGSLGFVRRLPELRELEVGDADGFDLRSLSGVPLEALTLVADPWAKQGLWPPVPPPGEPVHRESIDLAPLAEVPGLTSLIVELESHGWAHLAELHKLQGLELGLIRQPTQLAELAPLGGQLRRLQLDHVENLRDLSVLSFLDAPGTLSFLRCPALRDISQLTQWTHSLTAVGFSQCPVEDWAPLAQLTGLSMLRLDLTAPLDLSALADLRSLKMLRLGDPGQINLAPLARRSNLVVTVAQETEVFAEDLFRESNTLLRGWS